MQEFRSLNYMKKILTLFFLFSINAYAIDCYVTGDEFFIQNTLTKSKLQESGAIEDCQRWKVVKGKVEVFSDYKPRIAKIGQILLSDNIAKGGQTGLLSMLSDATDVEISGANFGGDELVLENMPNTGYVLLDDIKISSNQNYKDREGQIKTFNINDFYINKQKIKILNGIIKINNLSPSTQYTWIAIDHLGNKISGSFKTHPEAKLKKILKVLNKIGNSPKLSKQGKIIWKIWFLRNNGYFFNSKQIKETQL